MGDVVIKDCKLGIQHNVKRLAMYKPLPSLLLSQQHSHFSHKGSKFSGGKCRAVLCLHSSQVLILLSEENSETTWRVRSQKNFPGNSWRNFHCWFQQWNIRTFVAGTQLSHDVLKKLHYDDSPQSHDSESTKPPVPIKSLSQLCSLLCNTLATLMQKCTAAWG